MSNLLTQYLARRPQRLELLRQIAEQGSITRAAKQAGISYKTAWDAIDDLNNLAVAPLVERNVGGKGGGGARLTAEGQRILRLYQRLQALQEQMLAAVETDGDLELLNHLTLRTSARNQLLGRIQRIEPLGCNDLVHLELTGGMPLLVRITRQSTLHLGLEVGDEAIALIKAGWVKVHTGQANHGSENLIQGELEARDAAETGPLELRIRLANGLALCALDETRQHATTALGSQVQITLDPAQILLGISS